MISKVPLNLKFTYPFADEVDLTQKQVLSGRLSGSSKARQRINVTNLMLENCFLKQTQSGITYTTTNSLTHSASQPGIVSCLCQLTHRCISSN